jgi:hypothetical protein
MGTFTTSKQFQLGLNIANPWWLSGASIDLDFDNGRYYDSSLSALKQSLAVVTDYLSCTRASTGYANTSTGTLTSFSNNVLRLTDLGLLVEDARTNYCLHSQDSFDQSIWNNEGTNPTVTVNAATAPDGTLTAALVADNSSSAAPYINQSVTLSGASGTYTTSVYAKAGTSSIICVQLQTGSQDGACYFQLTGAGSAALRSLHPATSAQIKQLANGWYRCSIQCTSTGGGDGGALRIAPAWRSDMTGGESDATQTGNLYIWGVQVEAGAFLSSYIPTSGATATRAAESISISGSAQSLINSTTASIIAQLNNGGSINYAATAVDSNGTNLLGFDATNHGLASITASLATANTANRISRDKLGIAWSGAGRSLVLNGGTVATDATAQTPSATQKLGSAGGTSNFVYAYIERLSIWNSKLADATLQALTV